MHYNALFVNQSFTEHYNEGLFGATSKSKSQVVLETQSGDIRCEGLCALADVHITTQSGDVKVSNVKANVVAKTMSGDIELDNPSSQVSESAQTMAGDVNGLKRGGGQKQSCSIALYDLRLFNF